MSTHYRGTRRNGQCVVWIERDGRRCEELSPAYHIRNHSPTGLDWGYNGSGPAQLALALLHHATGGESITAALYQRFASEIVAAIGTDDWCFSRAAIRDWVASQVADMIGRGDIVPPNQDGA